MGRIFLGSLYIEATNRRVIVSIKNEGQAGGRYPRKRFSARSFSL
jgi:hypothetical protein